MNIQIKRLSHGENVPMDLLLAADPSEEMIEKYLPESDIYIAKIAEDVVGVFVLLAISEDEIELKNISVKKDLQRQGIGKEMVKYAIRISKMEGFLFLIVKTADSSKSQHLFYKKLKFEEYFVVKGHFMKYYPTTIVEDGIEAIDQIVFRRPI